MKYICPLIVVSEIKRSREFYEILLNQKVKFDFGENITFDGDFALHQKSHYEKLINGHKIQTGGNNFELYFENDDIEKIVEKLNKNGVQFVHGIQEQPWRQKVVRFYDPDKNIIEIGESLEHLAFRLKKEGLSNSTISKTTNMPVDFIKASIKKYEK